MLGTISLSAVVNNRVWYLGQVSNGQRTIVKSQAATLSTREEYEVAVLIRGKELAFLVGEDEVLTHTYSAAPLDGLFGLGADRSKAVVDNVEIREFVPSPVATNDSVQTVVGTPVDIAVLNNDSHESENTFIYLASVSQPENGTATLKDTNQDGKNDTITFTPAEGFAAQRPLITSSWITMGSRIKVMCR